MNALGKVLVTAAVILLLCLFLDGCVIGRSEATDPHHYRQNLRHPHGHAVTDQNFDPLVEDLKELRRELEYLQEAKKVRDTLRQEIQELKQELQPAPAFRVVTPRLRIEIPKVMPRAPEPEPERPVLKAAAASLVAHHCAGCHDKAATDQLRADENVHRLTITDGGRRVPLTHAQANACVLKVAAGHMPKGVKVSDLERNVLAHELTSGPFAD